MHGCTAVLASLLLLLSLAFASPSRDDITGNSDPESVPPYRRTAEVLKKSDALPEKNVRARPPFGRFVPGSAG